ncbi:hypothetical protein C8Q78DRAFT_1059458 [Trametes maxima]|nr:hypothetical protein C8Q78DRAFT_1059458 [Trametes maxima]
MIMPFLPGFVSPGSVSTLATSLVLLMLPKVKSFLMAIWIEVVVLCDESNATRKAWKAIDDREGHNHPRDERLLRGCGWRGAIECQPPSGRPPPGVLIEPEVFRLKECSPCIDGMCSGARIICGPVAPPYRS